MSTPPQRARVFQVTVHDAREDEPKTSAVGGRTQDGQGRRGHMRKVSLELAPAEHDRLKMWTLTEFGGGTAVAPVLRALLAEAYEDSALTRRVRRRLELRDA